MESNSFRKLLLIFAVILVVPVMNSIYGTVSAVVTSLIVLFAIIIIFTHFATRTGTVPKNRGICSDIKSINIKVNGRSYIISEGDSFNTEDHEQEGILSYVENGVWFIQDSPTQTLKGAIAEITIPTGLTLDALDICVQTGNLLINSISSKRCAINVYNDFAEIKALNTASLSASTGRGKLILNTSLTGNAVLSCGSGSLDVTVNASDKDFNLEAVTGAGNVTLNGGPLLDSTHRTEKIDNSAEHTIKASCGLGQLNINFTEVKVDEQN